MIPMMPMMMNLRRKAACADQKAVFGVITVNYRVVLFAEQLYLQFWKEKKKHFFLIYEYNISHEYSYYENREEKL